MLQRKGATSVDFSNWLTVPQAAKRLGVNVTTVYVAIRRGRIAVTQTPLGVLCSVQSVDDYDRTRRRIRHRGEHLVAAS
jgi:excisionase family DNA binding protein